MSTLCGEAARPQACVPPECSAQQEQQLCTAWQARQSNKLHQVQGAGACKLHATHARPQSDQDLCMAADRLMDVIHCDRRLYLVFEYLDLDLKRFMDTHPLLCRDHRLIKVAFLSFLCMWLHVWGPLCCKRTTTVQCS